MNEPWKIIRGDSPIICTAIHDGHDIRDSITDMFKVSESHRLREEDPFTGIWTEISDTRIIGNRSRFEFDLNRPRESAVYVNPEDAWGIEVWKDKPASNIIEESLRLYDRFYSEVAELLEEKAAKFGKFIVLDIHSYNHRRDGADGPEATAEANPEVNIGTGSVDRNIWGGLVDRFIGNLHDYDYFGRSLDVRENVKFMGGNFPRWINAEFSGKGVAIAVEFKKFFMDEWTGVPDMNQVNVIKDVLKSAIPGLMESVENH